MRYAIISDTHANIDAVEVVIKDLKKQSVDKVAFLGDAVGYGARPEEVCNLIRPLVDFAVLGNHDAAVTGRMDYSQYYDAAKNALNWTHDQLSETNLNWLKELPYTATDGDIEFSHGSPLYPHLFDYIFSPEQVYELINHYEGLQRVTFIGHSHLTLSFKIENDHVTPVMQSEILCEADKKYIITVGSVGQPRDRDPRASYGIYDTETLLFQYRRLEYDTKSARKKILKAGLAEIFGERLLVGM